MLNIGKVYRANNNYSPKDPIVDGMPNYYFETYVPNKKRQIIFEKGIYNVENVTGPDGIDRIPLIIISSSPHKAGSNWTPWSDSYDPDHGMVTYYGDNKVPGLDPLRKGLNNALLLNQLDIYRSNDINERNIKAVPVIFFERVKVGSRLKGNLKFHGFGILESAERVTQFNDKKEYFANYRFNFCVFSLKDDNENFNWQWIIDRCNPELTASEMNRNAPKSWKEWVKIGSEELQKVRRNVSFREIVKDKDQLPKKNTVESKILYDIYKYYTNNKKKHDFEWLAMDVTRILLSENGVKCPVGWVTEKSSDGGIDFVLRMDLGTDLLASTKIIILGQAKCTNPESKTNGNDIARTVSRMKRGGYIGSFVTTSYFTEAVQKEVNEDKYPIILINGITVARIVYQELFRRKISLEEYLLSIEEERQTRNPEDILNM